MHIIQTFLSVCGAISIIGGAIAVLSKGARPALKMSKRVNDLEEQLESIETTNKQLLKCMLAMINHEITGNGIDSMKEIRDELTETIINK